MRYIYLSFRMSHPHDETVYFDVEELQDYVPVTTAAQDMQPSPVTSPLRALKKTEKSRTGGQPEGAAGAVHERDSTPELPSEMRDKDNVQHVVGASRVQSKNPKTANVPSSNEAPTTQQPGIRRDSPKSIQPPLPDMNLHIDILDDQLHFTLGSFEVTVTSTGQQSLHIKAPNGTPIHVVNVNQTRNDNDRASAHTGRRPSPNSSSPPARKEPTPEPTPGPIASVLIILAVIFLVIKFLF